MSDDLNLGACCICEQEKESVRNILMLDKKIPIPGRGWGCFECHLVADGAVAVLCDECLEASDGKPEQIKFACRGYPGKDGRIPVGELEGEHEHNMEFHPEARKKTIFCKNCQKETEIADGYYCGECDEMLCIYCGCTDDEPCAELCHWTSDGVCSNCYDGLAEGNF